MKKALAIIFAVLGIDQAVKIWVKTSMYLGQEHRIFDWFIIHFTENNGMAFGLELGGEFGKILLTLFRIGAVVGLFYLLKQLLKKGAPNLSTIAFSLIIAGALGNILDSVFYGLIFSDSYGQLASFFPEGGGYAGLFQGRVVDMLYLPIYKGFLPEWIPFKGGDYFVFFRPVFNIADTAITVGVLILLLFQRNTLSLLDFQGTEKAEN